jgi:radical SAM superfamily enzyme YgiQ (UPF0313 family)
MQRFSQRKIAKQIEPSHREKYNIYDDLPCKSMTIPITFCDLSHHHHSTKMVPLGVSMVASYALKKFDGLIEAKVFKSVNDFANHLEKKIPRIACFSAYSWNSNLSYEIANRIKKKDPNTIIVFGGPDYAFDTEEQEDFLKSHKSIDIFIEGEGEEPFVQLLNVLFKYDFDIEKVKKEKIKIGSCHYIINGEVVRGELLPPISELDDIPSPYLSGLLDESLSQNFKPLMQTTRGCPFACTFCQEGVDYYSKIRRFSPGRVKNELSYLAKKETVSSLTITDSNFGMYKEDLVFSNEVASVREKYNWPTIFEGINGKNKQENILEAISIIGNTQFSAAVQTTDEQVLKNIKRKNISFAKMINVVDEAKKIGGAGFSELILGLPGDSKESHFKSNAQLIDSGVTRVRTHQLAMLPASELVSKENRKKFSLITRFRPVPMTVTPYRFFGEVFYAPEIDEICIGSDTLSIDNYVECRLFNLTIEIFYNSRIFEDLFKLIAKHDIKISEVIEGIHKRVRKSKNLLKLYDDFTRETNELWKTKEELVEILKNDKILAKFRSGEMGNNEQLVYSSIAILDFQEEIHEVTFGFAEEILADSNGCDEGLSDFLQELKRYGIATKKNMLQTESSISESFAYDIPSVIKSEFKENLSDCYSSEKATYEFKHTKKQQELIDHLFLIYGKSKDSLGFIISTSLQNNNLFRKPKKMVM